MVLVCVLAACPFPAAKVGTANVRLPISATAVIPCLFFMFNSTSFKILTVYNLVYAPSCEKVTEERNTSPAPKRLAELLEAHLNVIGGRDG